MVKKLLLLVVLGTVLHFFIAAQEALIEASWLVENISDDQIILDIRSNDVYEEGHIPGSVFSDYGLWRVKYRGLPGFLPKEKIIQERIREAGVRRGDHVIIISGVDSKFDFGRAARVYWTLKISGIENISILDGGIIAWIRAGGRLSQEITAAVSSNFVLKNYDNTLLSTQKEVRAAIKDGTTQIVDARPKDFFDGYLKASVSKTGGTIDTALNISQFSFISEDGTIIPQEELEAVVQAGDVQEDSTIISFCNTGHWAATNWFVFSELLGYDTKLYDGSFVEWSQSRRNAVKNKKSRAELKKYQEKKKS